MKSYKETITSHRARIIVKTTCEDNGQPTSEIADIILEKSQAPDPSRTVSFSIPELHKQLREYEATHPLPQITKQEVEQANAPDIQAHRAAKTTQLQSGLSNLLAGKPLTSSDAHALVHIIDSHCEAHRANNTAASPEEELPELHAGLTYPRDAEELKWLGTKLPYAFRSLTIDTEKEDLSIRRFTQLRHIARTCGRTDHELIECILAFRGQLMKDGTRITVEKLMEAVTISLESAKVAEISATEAADQLKELNETYGIPSASNDGASQAPSDDDLSGDRKRHERATAAVNRIHEFLKTDTAGLRITPSQATELCNRIQGHATLPEKQPS